MNRPLRDAARCVVAAWVLVMTSITAASAATPDYSVVAGRLRASGVAVLLPARLPATFGSLRSLAVIRADRHGYYLGFSNVRNCGGALSCATLHVAGYRADTLAGRSFGTDRPLLLPDRSQGYYTPRDCSGASCTESSLTFKRHGAIYEIDAKSGPADLAVILSVYRALRPVVPPRLRHVR